ncbi:MAG: glycosyltransferase [Desulfobacterales bacterium]
MKIFIYCQHVWGIGHLYRIREICRALAHHDLVVVTGGPEVTLPMPDHVKHFRLPAIRMDARAQLYADDGRSLEAVWPERIARLCELFRSAPPDAFLIEFFPLGRNAFKRELLPILAALRGGRLPPCRVYCSVRDILVEKRDQAFFEKRAAATLNRWFDALLVHADPSLIALDATFATLTTIDIPVVYTGYVAPPGAEGIDRQAFRQKIGLAPDRKLIVASAGGGQSGYPLLAALLAAQKALMAQRGFHLAIFTGPYLSARQRTALQRVAGPETVIRQFTPDFKTWLAAADISVSMAGYNTCMNLLTAGLPALVWPFEGDREQPLRAARLAEAGWLSVLANVDLTVERLTTRIEETLRSWSPPSRPLDLQGALKTAQFIEGQVPSKQSRREGRQ